MYILFSIKKLSKIFWKNIWRAAYFSRSHRFYEISKNLASVLITLNLFLCFCTIFSYVILGWYHDNLLMIKLSKQTSYWSNTVFFSQLKKVNNIFIFHPTLSWWHSKITYKIILQKDMNKFFISIVCRSTKLFFVPGIWLFPELARLPCTALNSTAKKEENTGEKSH